MTEFTINGNRFFNEDCIPGLRRHLADESVDLIITDPPYGIGGGQLHKHYNRDEQYVVGGYVEVPAEEYGEFSHRWIREAERVLKPNGQIYLVSGYTHLYDVLGALRATSLQEINHIIWKYNFGVYTRTKYVSSHYHILYYEKPGSGKRAFNLACRYGLQEKTANGGSLNYRDREDVWVINREYKPGRLKNKNELPIALLSKMILYSSHEGDLVCDPFLGGFSTARVAIGLNRRFVGFELSTPIFTAKIAEMKQLSPGDLLETLRVPEDNPLPNQGKSWSDADIRRLLERYAELRRAQKTKKETLRILSAEFGRGRWAIERILKRE